MPIFRVQVNYVLGSAAKWSNVWHVSASDLATAANEFATTGVAILQDLLHEDCAINSLLVSDPSTSDFITRPINVDGTSTHVESLLPLFNSAKILFVDGSFGRPDYKFLKGYLTEGTTENFNINSDIITEIDLKITDLITNMADASVPLVSADNDEYVSVSTQVAIQMRQMHRRRRRTVVTP